MTKGHASHDLKGLPTHQVFGANLRILIKRRGTIANACRALDINRVQMGRFLNGESFPKPGLLNRICEYFEVDARVMLEPLDRIPHGDTTSTTPLGNDFIHAIVERDLPEVLFNIPNLPPGIHVMFRQSYMRPNRYMKFLCLVSHHNGISLIRGNEPRLDWDTIKTQSRYPFSGKEWSGMIYRANEGFCYTYKDDVHQGVIGLGYFSDMGTFTENIHMGMCMLLKRNSPNHGWTVPNVLRVVPQNTKSVLNEARSCGVFAFEDLPSDIQTALRMCVVPLQFQHFSPPD